MNKKLFLTRVLLLAIVFTAATFSQAAAEYTYFEDFNTQLNPDWWTLSSSGSVASSYITDITDPANKLILMRYTPGSEGYLPGAGVLKFNFPLEGDFSASITYSLYNWPVPSNGVTAAIRTDLGDVVRLNNGSEFYMTNFTGDTTHSVATDDTQGRLRIIRNAGILQGAYYDPAIVGENKWLLIGQYNNPSLSDTDLAISLWPGVNATQNVSVIFDDFNLHVYGSATDPRGVAPEPASMLLFGVGAAVLAVFKKNLTHKS